MTEEEKRILFIIDRGLLDIRNAARKGIHIDSISKISHLLHNTPGALMKLPADKVYNRLQEKAKELDCEDWLQTVVHNYEVVSRRN